MEMRKLAGLLPERVFYWFEKICTIPHGSGNTKKISDFLVAFAKEYGLLHIQDAHNNVILFKAASPGYENHPPLILQGHMDMVCQKDDGVLIDMQTQGINVMHDGTYVFANGTTLGADDGIAVAFCLAILEDDSIAHPPLEVVITSDEEVGLIGANAIDLSVLRGKQMINLDTPYDNVFNVGCGGGVRVAMNLSVARESCAGQQVQFTLEGLRGGHSGSQIGKNFANANKVMVKFLQDLQGDMPFRLVALTGGMAGNVIPSQAQAVLLIENLDEEMITKACDDFTCWIKKTFDEPNAMLQLSLLEDGTTEALGIDSTHKALTFLAGLPNGVQQWSSDFDGLPLTSLNLGIVKLKEKLSILIAVRSGSNQSKQALQSALKEYACAYGCSHSESGIYSAWEYRKDSSLRDTVVRLYQQHNGKAPVVRVVHAGLECGVFSEKIPGLDCISMGPNILDIHTTTERLDIASTERTWNFLLEILKKL